VAGFGRNDNFALHQQSVLIAGRYFDHIGGFAKATYDGVRNGFTWDNLAG
jgi:hypothetical protein